MSVVLPPQKLVLLAVHLAADADIDSLASLTSKHPTVLRKDLVLRILLTYLPETVSSEDYVAFVEELASGELPDREPADPDLSAIDGLSDEEATKKVRKLRLLPLAPPDAPISPEDDPVTLFLLCRAYRVDEEAGMLTQLPALLFPFLHHTPGIHIWILSNLLPLLRRNYEYYTNDCLPYTLAEFQKLPDSMAVGALLSHTGAYGQYNVVGRDLRGLVGPWLHNNSRWILATEADESLRHVVGLEPTKEDLICPGWEKVLDWLTAHASRSWRIAVAAVDQWNGPNDVDLGDLDSWLREDHQRYLDWRYARAILACAYLIPETTTDALEGAHQMVVKAMDLLGEDDVPSLHQAAESLPLVSDLEADFLSSSKNTAWMRDDLLSETNPLTTPSQRASHLLHALILSAFLLTRAGLTCTVKRAGDLAFRQDEREQREQASQLIHEFSGRVSKKDENSWRRAREEILWLRNWGVKLQPNEQAWGVFGRIKTEYLEAEILKALLSNGHFSLAQAIYESGSERLPKQVLQDTIIAAALNAYDNASNPNRTRGGLKKCDEIINAFPNTVSKTLPARQRIEALLKATHALSEYRLVLKQGEPFSPVILRVHSDPISIIAKVLEQNAKSYTKIQDFEEVGSNMVKAGLTVQRSKLSGNNSPTPNSLDTEDELNHLATVEKRVTALCIEAALKEDDFETAYSFVVGRLASASRPPFPGRTEPTEDCSWRAALQAGQYIRNPHTTRPTHLGTASGNLEIRHLEQRIECLSTALRIAPPAQLLEILKTFRRCEEQLDSALKAEAVREAEDEENIHVPGGFGTLARATVRRHPAVPSAPAQSTNTHVDESPMSLFDLSRATARVASRNFAALSSLPASAGRKMPPQHAGAPTKPVATSTDDGDRWGDWGDEGQEHNHSDEQQRVRKRDQLRDAAMGTLTSGVGWLIGAQPPPTGQGRREQDQGDGW